MNADAAGRPVNFFVLKARNYASDQVMRCMASIMFHATIGKEFKDALLTMNYILKHPDKFMNASVAFSLSLMQMTAAIFLELIFVVYIQSISGAIDITKDFIAIQVITALDDFTGQMILSIIRKYVSLNFALDKTTDYMKFSQSRRPTGLPSVKLAKV